MQQSYTERDLWWEARQQSATQAAAAPAKPTLFKAIGMSLAGAPTRTLSVAVSSLGREKAGLVIDLNKYRAGRDLKKFVDAGADAFLLRIGGPGRWVSGDYNYTEDPTWRPYMEQADKLGMLNRTGGYIVHNPFEDWRLDQNVHVDLLNQWTGGGYMPACFFVDHEVAKVWQGGKETICTNFNLVKSLETVTDKIYRKFRRLTGIYSARWFLNTYGYTEHETFFDNVNKPESAGGPGKQRPVWLAWYGQQFTKEYPNLETSLSELFVPTGDQTGKFLTIGSYSKADLWQYTDRLKLPGDLTGVDASVTLGTLSECLSAFGMGATVTQPPVPDPKPEPEPDAALSDRVATLESTVANLRGWAGSFK